VKLETKIRLEPETFTRLQRLADRYGYSVAALVRNCIDARLDLLETQLARRAAMAEATLPAATPEPGKEGSKC